MATAIYARQSLDKKDSISIEAQVNWCKEKCDGSEKIVVYKDKGFSGKNTERPDFQRMMHDIENKKIEKVMVYRLDRLSRSIVDFGQMWEILEKNKVSFCSVSEEFDTSKPMGKAMIYIIMIFAQLERETISERVKDNYYERAKKGSWLGGPAPYGFEKDKIVGKDGRNVPSLRATEQMEIVKWIFEEYAKEETSLGSIAKELTERGIPCARRQSWDNVSVARILHSPLYAKADVDMYVYFKERGITNFSNELEEFDGTTSAQVFGKRKASDRKYTSLKEHTVALTNFEGAISSKLWLECQDKLNRNQQLKNTGKGKYTWLTGFLKCKECGYSICIKGNSRSEKKYLGCSGKYNLHICQQPKIELDISEIENAVQNEIEKVLEQCYGQNTEEIAVYDINEVEQKMQLVKIEEKIERLVSCMAEATDVTMKYLNKEIEKLDKQKQKIYNENARKRTKNKVKFKEIVFSELDMDEKRQVVETFIERILVGIDEIEIVWKV